MSFIKLKEISIYHPETCVGNEFYIEHFKDKFGRNITNMLHALGRNRRYIIDNADENSITMGIQAARAVIQKSGLNSRDIDMLIFSTQTPEYILPTNALFVHKELDLREDCLTFDLNSNCSGMTVAVENAWRYMAGNKKISYALVIGSDHQTLIANPEQEISYANYGDAAAAVILERSETGSGFISSKYLVNTAFTDMVTFPYQGMSVNKGNDELHNYIEWLPFELGDAYSQIFESIHTVVKEKHLSIDDISGFCFTQLSYGVIKDICSHFDLPEHKAIYIGDKYGYTGTSSPFLALHEAMSDGRLSRGDKVVIWSIGVGHQMTAMLLEL